MQVEWCTPLVNGCVNCAFNGTKYRNNAKRRQRQKERKTNKQLKTHETSVA